MPQNTTQLWNQSKLCNQIIHLAISSQGIPCFYLWMIGIPAATPGASATPPKNKQWMANHWVHTWKTWKKNYDSVHSRFKWCFEIMKLKMIFIMTDELITDPFKTKEYIRLATLYNQAHIFGGSKTNQKIIQACK